MVRILAATTPLRAAGLRAEHDDGVGVVQFCHAVRAAVAVGAQGGFVLGDEHPDALEFLQRGNGFVVQARRDEHGLLGGLGFFGGLPHGFEGFVPGGRLQFSVTADHRLQDALARFGPGFVTAAHAQVSVADRRIEIAEDLDDAIFLRINQQSAADGALGARGANRLAGAELAPERGGLVEQRPGGARRDTRAAARAGIRRAERRAEVHDDAVVLAAIGNIERVGAFHFLAGAHATGAQDAAVVVEGEVFARHVHRPGGIKIGDADGVNAVAVALELEFAIALVHHAERADVVALAEQQFQRAAAQFLERFAVGDDLFAVHGRGRARRHHLGAADNLDDAHAASAPRRQMFQVTERGNVDAVGLGDLQNRLPFLALATAAINRQRDFFRCNHFSITGFVARVEDVSKAAGVTARPFTPSEVLSTAPNLQASKHAPQ